MQEISLQNYSIQKYVALFLLENNNTNQAIFSK